MRVILLGAPGSGKGTQAKFIMKRYCIPHISTGDMLRIAVKLNNNLGKEVQSIIKSGKLVHDALIIKLVKERLLKKECVNGFLLDGFPRNITQADAMKAEGINVDFILEFIVPDELILERIVGRCVHVASGRIYHNKYNPPKLKGKDDITGEELVTRPDDYEATIFRRLKEYHQFTIPLICYYKIQVKKEKNLQYYRIDGTQPIAEVSAQLANILDQKCK